MAENIIHELNTQFSDMELKSKNKNRNKVEDFTTNKRCKNYNTEEHCMPYHALMDSKDITHICTLCGGNLYADITMDDVLKENLRYKLICPRGCEELPNIAETDNGKQYNKQPMGVEDHANIQRQLHSNGVYMSNYNSHQPHNMVAIPYRDYRFNLTTDLMAARSARLKQLLNTIDCDNCHRVSLNEKSNRFEAFKRKNVRRAEYELNRRKSYSRDGNSTAPDFSSDLSAMAESMFECSERLRRFYKQKEYTLGCEKCGGI
uniref:Uncharacterized protein n=1 Tax=Bactrocera latifrons TaxID=174628 RepID=A0A0K8TZZ2_BACLA